MSDLLYARHVILPLRDEYEGVRHAAAAPQTDPPPSEVTS
jgi:hypothetical protein